LLKSNGKFFRDARYFAKEISVDARFESRHVLFTVARRLVEPSRWTFEVALQHSLQVIRVWPFEFT
jgi:hypothetical protein